MFTGRSAWMNAWRLLAVLVVILAGCGSEDVGERKLNRNAYIDVSAGEKSACGLVIATTMSPASTGDRIEGERYRHSTTWIRSDHYPGMEDNDLRGFLDGTFKEGWNQVSQAHLRLGRRARNPAFGEYELFRNLQRWDGIGLPANAEVVDAKLTLSLESGPPFPVDVAVYAVRKDWNPGQGGVNFDNNSPPARGEVWWVDAGYQTLPWASAGAGYASDTDPQADTFAQPLALAHFEPGDTQLEFRAPQLARYVQQRVQEQAPLLLLYKLTDPHEDSIGSVFEVWSANVGLSGSARRPVLSIDWRAPPGTTALEVPVMLEPGRAIELRELEASPGEALAASFEDDASASRACGQRVSVEFREAGGRWRSLEHPAMLTADRFDLRITAATRPRSLGDTIDLEIRDTWIPEGTPADHVVRWAIRRPDGQVHQIDAPHIGDYTWQAQVTADIPGRWSFRWEHELSGSTMHGEWYTIDVVARNVAQVRNSLVRLEKAIELSGAAPRSLEMLPFEIAFMRLERALVATAARGDADEDNIYLIIQHLREKISGRDVPATFIPEPIGSREATPRE